MLTSRNWPFIANGYKVRFGGKVCAAEGAPDESKQRKCNLSALPELMLVLHFQHRLHVKWWMWKVCSLLCYGRWQMQSAQIHSSWWIPAAIQFHGEKKCKSICRSFPSHSCSTNHFAPVHLYAQRGLEAEIFTTICQNIAGFWWSIPSNEL